MLDDSIICKYFFNDTFSSIFNQHIRALLVKGNFMFVKFIYITKRYMWELLLLVKSTVRL